MPDLYPDIDEKNLVSKAKLSLIRYGGDFMPGIITKTHGVYVYAAGGQKVLGYTSGQMSCLIGS